MTSFRQHFELFGSCHKIYDSTEVDTNSIALLSKLTSKQYSGYYNCNLHYVGTNIKGFMGYYCQHFPNATVLPKMHVRMSCSWMVGEVGCWSGLDG